VKDTALKTFSVLALVLFAIGSTAALNPEQATENPNFEQGEAQEQGAISGFFSNFLSLTTSQQRVDPGGTITFDASPTATEDIPDISSLTKIVEVYRCEGEESDIMSVDPCADPNPFIEADRDGVAFEASLSEGATLQWSTDYQVPNERGTYEAVAYLYDRNQGKIVSTADETQFQVGEPAEPNIELAEDPSFDFSQDVGVVTGSITLENTGDGAMPNNDIVEMQVRPKGQGPLSFLSFTGNQDVCDEDYPNNVHRSYRIDPGDSETINLEVDTLEKGQSYEVFFLTREACYPDNDRVDPIRYSINAGSFTYESEDTGTGGNGSTGGGSGESGLTNQEIGLAGLAAGALLGLVYFIA